MNKQSSKWSEKLNKYQALASQATTVATLKQRTALEELYTKLGKSTKGIRDLSFQAASEAISSAIQSINENNADCIEYSDWQTGGYSDDNF